MRLWSLHPRYLDRPGLTAAWREALLAQAVLAGRTRGYTRHPQLERFRDCPDPLLAIGALLTGLQQEATDRGYTFDAARIDLPADPGMPTVGWGGSVPVTSGQVGYEWEHLMTKLARRTPDLHARWLGTADVQVHPLFVVVPGPIAPWERPGPG